MLPAAILFTEFIVCSCGAATRPTVPEGSATYPPASITILSADGTPAADAIVVLTSLDTGEQVATGIAGEQGTFSISVPTMHLALTATTLHEFAYVKDVTRLPSASIHLSNQCSQLEGHVEILGAVHKHRTIHINRVSDDQGDSFGADLNLSGDFSVCLPSAFYFVIAPAELAHRPSDIFVPQGGPFRIRTTTQAEIGKPLLDSGGISPESEADFITNLPTTTKLLAVAESNHGTREFNEERTRLALELARRKHFNLIFLEAGYGETLKLDEYINGRPTNISKSLQELGYWPWDTNDLLRSLEQLKVYNDSRPDTEHIHILGFDIQTSTGARSEERRVGKEC